MSFLNYAVMAMKVYGSFKKMKTISNTVGVAINVAGTKPDRITPDMLSPFKKSKTLDELNKILKRSDGHMSKALSFKTLIPPDEGGKQINKGEKIAKSKGVNNSAMDKVVDGLEKYYDKRETYFKVLERDSLNAERQMKAQIKQLRVTKETCATLEKTLIILSSLPQSLYTTAPQANVLSIGLQARTAHRTSSSVLTSYEKALVRNRKEIEAYRAEKAQANTLAKWAAFDAVEYFGKIADKAGKGDL